MEQENSVHDERETASIHTLASTDQDEPTEPRSKLFIDACNLARLGDYEKAKTAFLDVDSDCQEYGRAQYLLGCACNKLNEYDEYKEAIVSFEQAVHSFKATKETIPADLYYQKGFAHWKLGAYEDALKSFSTFIRKTDEENAHNGYLSRALVYCSMDHYAEALSDLNEANKLEENQTVYSLCCRGRTFAHLGQYQEAKDDFLTASRIDPQDFQSHLQLGIVHSELGQYSQALEEFDRALESQSVSNSNRAEICFRQALVYHSLGNADTATSKLCEAVSLNPKHARAYFRLGRAHLVAEKYSEALEALNTAHTLAPHDRDILYELGSLHERAERLKLALYERRRALGLQQPEPPRLETPDSEKSIPIEIPISTRSPSPQIDPRRPMNPHLLSAIEQEELLPITQNRLASYYKTLETYQLAIDNGESPEARAFMALCQEAQKDFVHAFDTMEKLYDELQTDPNACQSWLDCLEQLEKDKDTGELGILTAHRYSVMTRIETNRLDIEQDHQIFESDPSQNRKFFYNLLRKRMGQSLVAFSIIGCDISVVSHNLKYSLNDILWIIRYMSKSNSFVSAFDSPLSSSLTKGSKFLYTKDYSSIQDKLSLITGLGDHTDFFSVARQVAREITDRYKDQLLRLATNHSPPVSTVASNGTGTNQQQRTEAPPERVANFASKYVLETIRDQSLSQLGLSLNPKTNLHELTDIFINMICSAKSNQPRRFFQFTRTDANSRLLIQQGTSTSAAQGEHWILYEFFRAPGIKLQNNVEYSGAPWMKTELYGYRMGTQAEIDKIRN